MAGSSLEVSTPQSRRSCAVVMAACGCCVTSVLMTDLFSYFKSGSSEPWWSVAMVMSQCILLSPVPAVLILRRLPVATAIYALLLAAVLIGHVVNVAEYLGTGYSPKFSRTDFVAFAISGISIFVIIIWAADLLTNYLFILLKSIIGVFRDS